MDEKKYVKHQQMKKKKHKQILQKKNVLLLEEWKIPSASEGLQVNPEFESH